MTQNTNCSYKHVPTRHRRVSDTIVLHVASANSQTWLQLLKISPWLSIYMRPYQLHAAFEQNFHALPIPKPRLHSFSRHYQQSIKCNNCGATRRSAFSMRILFTSRGSQHSGALTTRARGKTGARPREIPHTLSLFLPFHV